MSFTSTKGTKTFHPKLVPVSVPTPILSFPGQKIVGFIFGEVTGNSRKKASSLLSGKITLIPMNHLKVKSKFIKSLVY